MADAYTYKYNPRNATWTVREFGTLGSEERATFAAPTEVQREMSRVRAESPLNAMDPVEVYWDGRLAIGHRRYTGEKLRLPGGISLLDRIDIEQKVREDLRQDLERSTRRIESRLAEQERLVVEARSEAIQARRKADDAREQSMIIVLVMTVFTFFIALIAAAASDDSAAA